MPPTKSKRIKTVSERYILRRIKKWLCDGTRPMAVTSELMFDKFGVPHEHAIRLMEKFYKMYAKKFDLKRSFYVVKRRPEDMDESAVLVGNLVREVDLEGMEDIATKSLYSIHRSELDRDTLLPTFVLSDPTDEQAPVSKVVKPKSEQQGINALARMTDESKKVKEVGKIDALFAKACEREKFTSPNGKKGLATPPKPAAEFFKPSPSKSKKDSEKANKTSASRRITSNPETVDIADDDDETEAPSASNTMFNDDDIFTTDDTGRGDPEPAMEEPTSSSKKPKKASKRATSPPKPKQTRPEAADDVENDSQPGKMKEMREVSETFVGEDGYLETRLVKKMVEVDAKKTAAPAPPPAKKARPAAAPKDTGNKKGQASIMSFFKKV
uniref:DNA polymerase delta subunit 3 n=1 Tax=Panagrellus redivivus TaxID=6233 RepID=A0A7E4W191_PANRE